MFDEIEEPKLKSNQTTIPIIEEQKLMEEIWPENAVIKLSEEVKEEIKI
jgi:hypothetical protein